MGILCATLFLRTNMTTDTIQGGQVYLGLLFFTTITAMVRGGEGEGLGEGTPYDCVLLVYCLNVTLTQTAALSNPNRCPFFLAVEHVLRDGHCREWGRSLWGGVEWARQP